MLFVYLRMFLLIFKAFRLKIMIKHKKHSKFIIDYIRLLKDTRNCPEKEMKIGDFNPNQSAPSIYIMIELCFFSLDQ